MTGEQNVARVALSPWPEAVDVVQNRTGSPNPLFRRLIKLWSAPHQPGRVRPGATFAEIKEFETRHGVRLPSDFREYLLVVNGMDSNDSDDLMTSFWGLDRIQPASNFYPPGKRGIADADADRWYIFCDIMIDSFWYANRLADDPAAPSPVVMCGFKEATVVAPSFTDFIEAYVRNPGALPNGMPPLA